MFMQDILKLSCSPSLLMVEENVFTVHMTGEARIKCPDSGVVGDSGELWRL